MFIWLFIFGYGIAICLNKFVLTRYLSEQKLPKRMLRLQNGINVDEDDDVSVDDNGYTDSGEDCVEDLGIQRILEGLRTSPYVIGDLQVISLGNFIWTSSCSKCLDNVLTCWFSCLNSHFHVLIETIYCTSICLWKELLHFYLILMLWSEFEFVHIYTRKTCMGIV